MTHPTFRTFGTTYSHFWKWEMGHLTTNPHSISSLHSYFKLSPLENFKKEYLPHGKIFFCKPSNNESLLISNVFFASTQCNAGWSSLQQYLSNWNYMGYMGFLGILTVTEHFLILPKHQIITKPPNRTCIVYYSSWRTSTCILSLLITATLLMYML